tara:strand:- start:117 stop:791 length:675 start_codon:yes stop_codon:yes gene_type:complete
MSLKQYISQTGINKVEQAIQDAEQNTSCEVVPVIINRSDNYQHASYAFAFLLAIVSLACLWLLYPPQQDTSSVWSSTNLYYLGLMIADMLIVYMVGIFIAEKCPSIKLLFLSKQDMIKRVQAKTLQLFHILHVGKTKNNTGIIITISLFEHVVDVHGDSEVSKYFDQQQWDQVRDIVIAGIKKGDLAEGLANGLRAVGRVVQEKLPRQQNDENEISDRLHIINN